jgi:TolA-binding protein
MTSPRIQLALTLAAVILAMPAATSFADPADDQFAVAAGHYAARRWDLAVEEFQKFLTEYPDHASRTKALFFCGEALVQTNKYAVAQTQFEAALEADPQGRYARQALFRAGECAYWDEKSADARATLLRFSQKYVDDPLNAYALNYLGELALRAGDNTAAKTHYNDAIERFGDGPTASDCRLGLAQAHLGLAEYRQAETALKGLLEEERLTVEVHYWLGRVSQAEEQWDNAAKEFQAAIAADPRHKGAAILRYQAGQCLFRAKAFQAAIDVLYGGDQAQTAEPLPATHRYLVALAQQGLGRHDEALVMLETLPTGSDQELSLNVLLARAASFLALDRQRDAIVPLTEYLAAMADADTSRRQRALAQLALCYARDRDFARGGSTLAQLAAIEPQPDLYWTTTLQMAQLAAAARETNTARAWFESAGENAPDTIAAQALAGLAQLKIADGELENAVGCYERLLQRFPDSEQSAASALACGRLRERLEQFDAALAMYHLVIERHAESEHLPQALLAAASLCDRLSQEAKAIEHYERLARDFADTAVAPAAIYGWAWCLRESKRDAEANEKFEMLRRDYPSSQYWADAIYRLALYAARSKQLERAVELLDELIEAAGSTASDGRTTAAPMALSTDAEGGAQATVSDEDTGDDAPPKTSNDAATVAPAETLEHGLYLRAQIAITLTKWDEAERDLERLMFKHRSSPLALPAEFLRAEVAYRRSDFEEAARRFAALAPRLKDRNDRWVPMVTLRRAQVLAQHKQWSEARRMAESIEQMNPDFDQQFEADYVIGRAYAAEANLDEARKRYQKVVRSPQGGKTETAAMAQWMIGESYLLQEQYAVAIREYLRAEALYAYPHWQAAALLQAGKCYEQLGQWKNAGDAYARLSKLYAKTEFASEARERLQDVQTQIASRPKSK